DLSLNVSRELIQQDEHVAGMKSALTRRALDMLERLQNEDAAKYAQFWKEFGSVLKEGLAEDPGNKERIAGLLRFGSTRSATGEQDRSLADYIAAAKPEQQAVYYLIADSAAAARSSPHLEAFRERDIDALLLSDRSGDGALHPHHPSPGHAPP